MVEQAKATDTTPTDAAALAAAEAAKAAAETKTEGQEAPTSLMDTVTAEEKEAQAVEEKRLLEAKDEDLTAEDKTKKAELIKAKDEAAKASVVPEKYDIKVPEGLTLDQALLDKITPIFKDAKISQATAQKLADAYSEIIKAQVTESQKVQQANFDSFVEDLKKETIAELSKDGKDYKKELAFAAKTRDRFMSKELVEKLNLSGLANDIDVIRHLITIGKAISEDKVIEGKGSGAEDTSDKATLTVLYPTTPPK